MTFTISSADALRQSVEAATGGLNTVVYDNNGNPSIMVVVPKFNLQDIDASLGTGVHPAFIVDGVEKSEILIGKYPACVFNSRAQSIPGQDPAASVNWDAADGLCTAKGAGWHMMTNAEWAACALLAWKQGFEPRGNTNWGRDYLRTDETAARPDGGAPGVSSGTGRTRAGGGPVSWYHDNSPRGVADLCGNVWEWVRGMRINNGEIQVIANNDAADSAVSHAVGSAAWRAILEDGSLVAPGTANTLKWDASGATGTGSPVLAKAVTSQSDGTTSASQQYKDLTAPGVTPPAILKALALYPHASTTLNRGRFYMRNAGERMPRRGGSWNNGANAGVFALSCSDARSLAYSLIGFRPAFYV
jgi:formylglycine-generating enzyme